MGIVKLKFERKMGDVEENIFLARVAEQAERFEDMVDYLSKVLESKGGDVSAGERNLISVAFKNLISSKREACRTIAAIEQNPKYSKFGDALTKYKGEIEGHLIAENAKDAKLDEVRQQALKSYDEANQIELAPCNPIKLGLALNFSVFHYEVMKNHKAACDLADKALQEALDKIDELEEDDFRDAKSIIELLKENLTLWKEEEEGDDNAIDDL